MTNQRTRLQRKATEPAAATSGAARSMLPDSPAMLAQRKQLAGAFGGAAQLAGPEEELQKKSADEELQKKAPEEELGKAP